METFIGFVAGYLAGCKDGQDGVKRLRASAEAIMNSGEFRRLTAEAMTFAEGAVRRAATGRRLTSLPGTVGTAAETLMRHASGLGKDPRAA